MRNPFRRRASPRPTAQTSYEIAGIRYDARSAGLLARAVSRDGWTSWFGRIRHAMASVLSPEIRSAGVETRAIQSLPWNVGDPLTNVATQDRALSLVPVYAAVRLLADTVATLPVKAYRRINDERRPMITLPQLFALLDDSGELTDWVHRCMTSLALHGNAYGLVLARDGMQFPTAIEWLNPTEVYCDDQIPVRPIWYWRGRQVPSEDLLHIPWFTVPGKVKGLSPIEAYAATINVGIQSQDYGSTWFVNGGVPPGTFKNSQRTVSEVEAAGIKERLVNAIRSRKPIVYGSDWDYNAIAVPPEQAQFIETQRLTATQVAAIYGIPPEMIGGESGGSLTYNTLEQHTTFLATLTLRPWLVKLERKFSAILPMRQYVKFVSDAIVRTDLQARYNAYKVAAEIGLLSLDELRALEDRPPLPAGKQLPRPTAPDGQAPNLRHLPGLHDQDLHGGIDIPGFNPGDFLDAWTVEGSFGTVAMGLDHSGDVRLSIPGSGNERHDIDMGNDDFAELLDALGTLAAQRDDIAGDTPANRLVSSAIVADAAEVDLYGSGVIEVTWGADSGDPITLPLDPPYEDDDPDVDEVAGFIEAGEGILDTAEAEELRYSPDQPREPAGTSAGGQFGAKEQPKSGMGAKPKSGMGRRRSGAKRKSTTLSYDPRANNGTGYDVKGGDPRVKELQRALNRLGLTDAKGRKLAVDGKFGPLTTQAVKAAQKRLGLKPTGRVTPALLARLTSADPTKRPRAVKRAADPSNARLAAIALYARRWDPAATAEGGLALVGAHSAARTWPPPGVNGTRHSSRVATADLRARRWDPAATAAGGLDLRHLGPLHDQKSHGRGGAVGAIFSKVFKFGRREVSVSAHDDGSRTLDFGDVGSVNLRPDELDSRRGKSLRSLSFDLIDRDVGEGVALTRYNKGPDGSVRSEFLLGVKKVAQAPEVDDDETWHLDTLSIHLPPNADPSFAELMGSPGVEMRQGDVVRLAEQAAELVAVRVDTGSGSVDVFRDGGRYVLRPQGGPELPFDRKGISALDRALDALFDDDDPGPRPSTETAERIVPTNLGDVTVRMTGDGDRVEIVTPNGTVTVDSRDRYLDFAAALGELVGDN